MKRQHEDAERAEQRLHPQTVEKIRRCTEYVLSNPDSIETLNFAFPRKDLGNEGFYFLNSITVFISSSLSGLYALSRSS